METLSRLIDNLTSRQWFSRRWIIHEYELSIRKTFLIGDQWICSTDLVDILHELRIGKSIPVLAKANGQSRRSRYWNDFDEGQKNLNKSVFQCLQVFGDTQCQHPLDCIYAFLGISSDRDAFSVDYNLSPRELFARVAERYLQNETNLPLLLQSAVERSINPERASWLPE